MILNTIVTMRSLKLQIAKHCPNDAYNDGHQLIIESTFNNNNRNHSWTIKVNLLWVLRGLEGQKRPRALSFLVYRPLSVERLGCHEYVLGLYKFYLHSFLGSSRNMTNYKNTGPMLVLAENYCTLQQYSVLSHGSVWTQAGNTSV